MSKPMVLALGTFDGMHLGHKKLIEKTVDISKKRKFSSACYSFNNVPVSFSLHLKHLQLMSCDDKKKALEELGIEHIIMRDFDLDLMNTEAESFVKELLSKYNIKHMVVGKDFSFGKGGKANSLYLKRLGDVYGYDTEIIDFVLDEEGKFSSSRLRAGLIEGDLSSVRHLLGRNFCFSAFIRNKLSAQNSYVAVPNFDMVRLKQGRYKIRLALPTYSEELYAFCYVSDFYSDLVLEFQSSNEILKDANLVRIELLVYLG